MTHTSLILLTTCSYPWILLSSYTHYCQLVMSEYQKNKEDVDGEETHRNINIDYDCYHINSAIAQLWKCVFFRLAVAMGNSRNGNFMMSFVFTSVKCIALKSANCAGWKFYYFFLLLIINTQYIWQIDRICLVKAILKIWPTQSTG